MQRWSEVMLKAYENSGLGMWASRDANLVSQDRSPRGAARLVVWLASGDPCLAMAHGQ